jgi:hypothetical protein
VRREDDAVEHGEVAHAEHAGDEPAGERHGAEPKKTYCSAEGDGQNVRERQQQKRGDDQGASEVDGGQHPFLPEMTAQRAKRIAAEY